MAHHRYTNLRLGHLIVVIESNYKDAEWCLRHAIAQWLKLNYLYKKYGHPSWRMLAKAIRQLDGELVEKIAQGLGIPHDHKKHPYYAP